MKQLLSIIAAVIGMIPQGLVLLTSSVLVLHVGLVKKESFWFNSNTVLKRAGTQ